MYSRVRARVCDRVLRIYVNSSNKLMITTYFYIEMRACVK